MFAAGDKLSTGLKSTIGSIGSAGKIEVKIVSISGSDVGSAASCAARSAASFSSCPTSSLVNDAKVGVASGASLISLMLMVNCFSKVAPPPSVV